MSSYHSSFKYLDKKSDEDFGWVIVHFDPDNGESDSSLSQEQIYSESYNGTKRTLYGTKYNSVPNVKITVVKKDGSDFSLVDCRNAYKWLTGNPEANWMDLYIGEQVRYRLLCTIQDVKPQKIDARTVGLNIYCESLSPWAYSSQIKLTEQISGNGTIEINNESDDLYTSVYLKTTYKNTSGNSLVIKNTTIGESTEVSGLAKNEVITLDNNMMITSDKPSKVFGNSFNFVWPRLKSGVNNLSVTGTGNLTLEYCYPIKMGDCAIDINAISDKICNDNGEIIVDTLDWNRISNTPTTVDGYKITDVYTKTEVDTKLKNLSSSGSGGAQVDTISWYKILDTPTTISGYGITDVYNKTEINAMISIDEDELNLMLTEVLV